MLQFVNSPIAIPLRLMAGVEPLFESARLGPALGQRLARLINLLMRGAGPLFELFVLSFEPLVAIGHFFNQPLQLRPIAVEIAAFVFAVFEVVS
jgi:hypothetical protein